MIDEQEARRVFEIAASASDDVYKHGGDDAKQQLNAIAEDIRKRFCVPFFIEAKVMAPAFPWLAEGEAISGYCIAHDNGYWLVYQPVEDRFLCFWGTRVGNLGAPGIFGSPQYCWTA